MVRSSHYFTILGSRLPTYHVSFGDEAADRIRGIQCYAFDIAPALIGLAVETIFHLPNRSIPARKLLLYATAGATCPTKKEAPKVSFQGPLLKRKLENLALGDSHAGTCDICTVPSGSRAPTRSFTLCSYATNSEPSLHRSDGCLLSR